MTDKKDIWLTCLEHGFNCGDKGVSYNEMKQHLADKGLIKSIYNFDFNYYFYIWFFDNFFHYAIYHSRRTGNSSLGFVTGWLPQDDNGKQINNHTPNGQLEEKCPMTYEARQKYLDYLSLKESDRKSDEATTLATSANKLSKKAIVLSVALGLISIVIGAIQIIYASRQDNFNISNQSNEQVLDTRAEQLEVQVEQLWEDNKVLITKVQTLENAIRASDTLSKTKQTQGQTTKP